MPACPSCGSANAESAKFCSECSAPLVERRTLLRARGARALLADGRTAEAAAELGRARSFWLSVGAVALLRELDEILAAAS